MTFLLSVLLGLVQGLAEFLPISSSGHLAIFQQLIPELRDTPILFDVMLHLGTLVAVCIFYRKDILAMLRELGQLFSDVKNRRTGSIPPARRMIFLILVGSLPLVVFMFLSDVVDQAMGSLLVVGLFLCLTALLLLLADRMPRGKKTEKDATMVDALVVGVCQGIAIVPGLSRSGTTITAGLFRRFDRAFAVRFSFLLSLPAVLGATVLELVKALKVGAGGVAVPLYIVGALVAGVSGYFAIGFIQRLVKKGKFGGFIYYCLAAGLVAITLSFFVK